MLNICNNYSKRWRYELNPSKSNILVFRESKQTQKRLSKERDWSISNSPIVENITGKHVGVLLQCDMKSTERTLSACRRLRSTFMSIIGIGANPDFMHPLTTKRLYVSICIPRALFGCEIWGSLSYPEIKMLEKRHIFCMKYIQRFRSRTRSDVCTAVIGITDIQSFIHKRQLLFLRRMCTLPKTSRVKDLFLFRLLLQCPKPKSHWICFIYCQPINSV